MTIALENHLLKKIILKTKTKMLWTFSVTQMRGLNDRVLYQLKPDRNSDSEMHIKTQNNAAKKMEDDQLLEKERW